MRKLSRFFRDQNDKDNDDDDGNDDDDDDGENCKFACLFSVHLHFRGHSMTFDDVPRVPHLRGHYSMVFHDLPRGSALPHLKRAPASERRPAAGRSFAWTSDDNLRALFIHIVYDLASSSYRQSSYALISIYIIQLDFGLG